MSTFACGDLKKQHGAELNCSEQRCAKRGGVVREQTQSGELRTPRREEVKRRGEVDA